MVLINSASRYRYDDVNNRTDTINRNGRSIHYTYDNLNRIVAEDWLDSPLGSNLQTFIYKYDTNSNIISADDGSIRYEYSYEERDLEFEFDRLSAGEPTVSFVRKYNDVGNLTEAKKLVAGVLGATTSYE